MTIAEQLREEMAQSVVFDRDKVIDAECEAIRRFLTDNGFRCVVYHHPASGRPIGYKIML